LKKVLLITYYFPPSGGSGVQRPLKFIKYLQAFGWEPTVYTVENGEFPEIDESLVKEIPSNITILKKKIFEPFRIYKWLIGQKKDYKLVAGYISQKKRTGWVEKFSFWVRSNLFIPDARMFWIIPSVRYLSKYLKENKFDAIITSGPPHSVMLIGLALKKKTNLPWLADFRDPWTDIDFYKDLNLTKWADKIHHKLELKVLTQADCVVCVGKTWGKNLEEIGGRKVEFISNGFDDEDINDNIKAELDAKFSLVHIGMMGKSRNHKVLWQAIAELRKENEAFNGAIQLKFYGKLDASVPESIKKWQLEEISEIFNYVPHSQIVYIQKSAQVLYLSVNNAANAIGILTGKIYEYLAVKRPILCIGPPKGEAAQIIKETEAGLVSDFEDLETLKKNILILFNNFQCKKPFVGGKNIEKYSRKYQTGQLASLLGKIVNN
jgi:glycosyltransferase involved in cell wall biosynthesis